MDKYVELLRVLYLWHKARLVERDYLMADETKIRVLKSSDKANKKGKAHQGYFLIYYDPGVKQVLFIYDPNALSLLQQSITNFIDLIITKLTALII